MFALSDLKLPQELPVSLPASLAAQRPDIKAQEMAVRQASAAIGVATANMLPQLTLTGAYGGEAWHLAEVAAPGFSAWNIAAGVTQPLFQGGTLRAKRRAAIAEFDHANAQYRLVVIRWLVPSPRIWSRMRPGCANDQHCGVALRKQEIRHNVVARTARMHRFSESGFDRE